jgi:hypothetical protein
VLTAEELGALVPGCPPDVFRGVCEWASAAERAGASPLFIASVLDRLGPQCCESLSPLAVAAFSRMDEVAVFGVWPGLEPSHPSRARRISLNGM